MAPIDVYDIKFITEVNDFKKSLQHYIWYLKQDNYSEPIWIKLASS